MTKQEAFKKMVHDHLEKILPDKMPDLESDEEKELYKKLEDLSATPEFIEAWAKASRERHEEHEMGRNLRLLRSLPEFSEMSDFDILNKMTEASKKETK